MKRQEFDRSISDEDVFKRRATLLQRLHIDGWLLLILLVLAAGVHQVVQSERARVELERRNEVQN